MNLPFFDLSSSARYLANLLSEADPPFASIALCGSHDKTLAKSLRKLFVRTSILNGPHQANVVIDFDFVHTLPRESRADHVKQLAALAKHELLIACPLGTELQNSIYRSLERLARDKGFGDEELAAAVQNGLPTPAEAESWANGFADYDLFYAGDAAYFQDRATRFLSSSDFSYLRRCLLKLSSATAPSVSEADLPPETVPMRRHRRLFLLIRKR